MPGEHGAPSTMRRATPLLLGVLAICSAVTSFMVQVVATMVFGAGSTMDAYWASSTLPLVLGSIGGGTVAYFAVPLLSTPEDSKEEATGSAFTSILALTSLPGVAVGVLMLATPGTLIDLLTPGLSAGVRSLSAKMLTIQAPIPLAATVLALGMAELQVRGSYLQAAALPFVSALTGLAGFVALRATLGDVTPAAASTLALTTGAALALLTNRQVLRWSAWRGPDRVVMRDSLRTAVPLLVSVMLTSGMPAVDRYFLSALPLGALTYVSLAQRITSAGSVVCTQVAGVVLFAEMSQDAARRDVRSLFGRLSVTLRIAALVSVPAVVFGVLLSPDLAAIGLTVGKFAPQDAHAVGVVLSIYAPAIALMVFGQLLARACYALKDPWRPTLAISAAMAAYVPLVALLVRPLGALAIPAATVGFYALTVLLLIVIVSKQSRGLFTPRSLRGGWIRVGVSTIAAAGFFIAVAGRLEASRNLERLMIAAPLVVALLASVLSVTRNAPRSPHARLVGS